MRLRQLVRAALAAALFPLAAVGCGDPAGKATVAGEVTYAGAPVASGTIQFTPKDGKGVVTGGPIADGKFSVPNVPVGPTVISVVAGAPSSGPISSEESARLSQERLAARKPVGGNPLAIPPGAVGNNEAYEVKGGVNVHNVTITAPRTR